MASTHHDSSLDQQSRFGEILAILTVGCVLSTVAVVLRCFTRLKILHTFGPDDAVMAVAQVLTIGSAVAIGLESKWGLGRHSWTMPADNYFPYMKSFYSSVVVYNVAVCLTKISILLQYRRIFAGQIMQRMTLYLLVFLTAWAITLAFLLSLVCVPVAAFWDTSIEGRCLDSLTIWYVMAGVNLVTDFTIFSMPLPVIRSLQLPRRQKYALFLVFGLGFFTCAISIYRIRTLRVAAETTDPTWDNVDAATWSFLELTIAVLAACLPTLRPIFVVIMPRFFGSSTSRSRTGGSQYPRHNGAPWSPSRTKTSTFKGTVIKDSDSTEGLQHSDDIEFGLRDIDRATEAPTSAYSVTVSGGNHYDSDTRPLRVNDSGVTVEKGGIGSIKTTTVVTQEITFDNERP